MEVKDDLWCRNVPSCSVATGGGGMYLHTVPGNEMISM